MNEHPSSATPSRRIHLDGPVNFRDLGGYRTTGGSSVRWREVYRADALHEMSDRDAGIVFEDLGVGLVLDLRSEREVDLVGIGPVGSSGATWIHLSVIDETQPAQQSWQALLEDVPMHVRYGRVLSQAGPRFVEALELIAENSTPLVFHCTAGKDRTGILAALLLSALGVPDTEVVGDYAATSEVMHTIESRYLARAEDPRFSSHVEGLPAWRDQARKLMTADAETMRRTLGELRGNDLTVEGWLTRNGLSPATMSQLRGRLLAN